MNRRRFVSLGLLAVGLVVGSFLVRGFGRLLLPYDVAVALSAPLAIAAFALVVSLTVLGALDLLGVRPVEE